MIYYFTINIHLKYLNKYNNKIVIKLKNKYKKISWQRKR